MVVVCVVLGGVRGLVWDVVVFNVVGVIVVYVGLFSCVEWLLVWEEGLWWVSVVIDIGVVE